MRPTRLFLVVLCLHLSTPGVAPADDFLWTGNAGSEQWDDAGNWQNQSVVMENMAGVPAINDTVRFSSDASVVASMADRFGGFIVDENTSFNLQSVGFDRLLFSNRPTTEIQNAGEFSINAGAGQERENQLDLFVRAIDLTGGGTTTLSNVFIEQLNSGTGLSAITNRDNTLRASGSIQLPIYNDSLIRVDLGQLAASIRNRGVVEVDTGSELIADIENTADGLVQVAPNGIISGSIRGGSLHGDGALIQSSSGFGVSGISLTDVDLSGSFTATEGLLLSGTINNDATVAADSVAVGSLVNLNGCR